MIYSLDDLHHLGISYYVNFLGHLGKNGFQRRFGIHGNWKIKILGAILELPAKLPWSAILSIKRNQRSLKESR